MRSAEAELFKDKVEVTLDGRQIFYLFFGGAVIASLVFVLGVMVGKRVVLRSQTVHASSTSVAADPLAALDQLGVQQGGEELVFRRALGANAEAKQQPLGSIDEVLIKREEADAQRRADSAARAGAKGSEAKRASPKTPSQRATSEAEKPSIPGVAEQKDASGGAGAGEPVAGNQPTPSKVPTPAAPRAVKNSSRFTLQLSSFQNRSEADSFYGKLKDAGFKPYIVEADVPGKGLWYRVRLGEYKNYAAAIEAKKSFERSEHTVAYVTRFKR